MRVNDISPNCCLARKYPSIRTTENGLIHCKAHLLMKGMSLGFCSKKRIHESKVTQQELHKMTNMNFESNGLLKQTKKKIRSTEFLTKIGFYAVLMSPYSQFEE